MLKKEDPKTDFYSKNEQTRDDDDDVSRGKSAHSATGVSFVKTKGNQTKSQKQDRREGGLKLVPPISDKHMLFHAREPLKDDESKYMAGKTNRTDQGLKQGSVESKPHDHS